GEKGGGVGGWAFRGWRLQFARGLWRAILSPFPSSGGVHVTAPPTAHQPIHCAGTCELCFVCVIAGLVPAIHRFNKQIVRWMRGSSPRMTGLIRLVQPCRIGKHMGRGKSGERSQEIANMGYGIGASSENE